MGAMKLGYFELAMGALDQCISSDPQYGTCHMHKATLYLLRGERSKGIALFVRNLESGFSGGRSWFVSAFALSGNRVAALLIADEFTDRTGAPIKDWVNLIENPDIDRRAALEALDRWVERETIDVNQIDTMPIAVGDYDRLTH